MNRYWVTVLVGPCSEEDAEKLTLAVADLPECRNIGGCAGYERAEDQEPPGVKLGEQEQHG